MGKYIPEASSWRRQPSLCAWTICAAWRLQYRTVNETNIALTRINIQRKWVSTKIIEQLNCKLLKCIRVSVKDQSIITAILTRSIMRICGWPELEQLCYYWRSRRSSTVGHRKFSDLELAKHIELNLLLYGDAKQATRFNISRELSHNSSKPAAISLLLQYNKVYWWKGRLYHYPLSTAFILRRFCNKYRYRFHRRCAIICSVAG